MSNGMSPAVVRGSQGNNVTVDLSKAHVTVKYGGRVGVLKVACGRRKMPSVGELRSVGPKLKTGSGDLTFS